VCLAHIKNCAKQKVGSVKNFKNTFFFFPNKKFQNWVMVKLENEGFFFLKKKKSYFVLFL
jgi:hypothetical protein